MIFSYGSSMSASLLSSARSIVKKSKFFAELYFLESEEDVKEALDEFSRRHKKSDHICYAYRINGGVKFRNDGEVGNPGRALLDVLNNKGLDSHLLVVARYFGGIKLGPGGVGRAFRSVGVDCVI